MCVCRHFTIRYGLSSYIILPYACCAVSFFWKFIADQNRIIHVNAMCAPVELTITTVVFIKKKTKYVTNRPDDDDDDESDAVPWCGSPFVSNSLRITQSIHFLNTRFESIALVPVIQIG